MASVASLPTETVTGTQLATIVRSMQQQKQARVVFRTRHGVIRKTFAECYDDACGLAAAFQRLGLKEGGIVAIYGSTSYEWLLADLACVLNGAVSLALYPNALLPRVVSIALEMKAALVLTDQPDSVGKFIAAGFNTVLLSSEIKDGVASTGSLLRESLAYGSNWQPSCASAEPFTIVSTSGTLSEPKFFAVASYPLMYTMDRFKQIFELCPDDSLLLAMPLAHLPQRMLLYGVIKHGIDLSLSSPTTFLRDVLEFQPTIHVVVPRMLQYVDERLTKAMSNGKGAWIRLALPLLKVFPWLAYQLLGARIFGPRARCIFVGSAATPREVLERLQAIGCPIYEVYGTTELGILALSTPRFKRIGSVGKIVDWGEASIEPDTGEVLFRTDLPFLAGLVVNGRIELDETLRGKFARTGDIGSLDAEGYLTLQGRVRDFVALLSGKKIFVRPIEDRLSAIHGVAHCVAVGDGQKHLSAVLFAHPDVAFNSPDERLAHFRKTISEINQELGPEERIRRFLVVDEQPSIENRCLTETLKLRRHAVNEKYAKDYQRYETV
jgi:long-chain acyl-CoA synthetase